MRQSESEGKVLTLEFSAVAGADQVESDVVTLGHSLNHVGHQRARESLELSPDHPGRLCRLHVDVVTITDDLNVAGERLAKSTFRSLRLDVALAQRDSHA